MKIKVSLNGTLTSKRAMHLPVIRRWRLVWERVEFGTKVDRIDKSIEFDVQVSKLIDGPIEYKVAGDLSISLDAKDDGLILQAKLFGYPIPGASKILPLPTGFYSKVFDLRSVIYKGVELDISSVVVGSPS